jgi:hypothetical protein
MHFGRYEDCGDYFGARWNCYLSDIIATIPVPLTFAKEHLESGVAARLLNEFAADPYPYFDEAARKKMNTVLAIFSGDIAAFVKTTAKQICRRMAMAGRALRESASSGIKAVLAD